MNFEKHIKQISNSNDASLDYEIFLEKLHLERKKREIKRHSFLSSFSAAAFVILFSWISFSQLTDDPMIYTSTDLKAIKFMDIETEIYVYELADYLVESSDDIWETIAFLDEMNFETIVTKNNGGLE